MRHIDIDNALRRVADRRIEEAMREGKFDNLPGRGLPCDPEPAPADENARMVWWALRLLKNAGHTPEEVRWRKRIEATKHELARTATEDRVKAMVGAINAMVKQLNTLGTNAINLPVAPVDLEAELKKLRERMKNPPSVPAALAAASAPMDLPTCANGMCESTNPIVARFCRRCGAPIRI
jgi:hypothetical protein